MNPRVRRLAAVVPAVLLLATAPLRADEKSPSATTPATPSASTNAPAASPAAAPAARTRDLLVVRASPTPLGENSVIAESAGEARQELESLRNGTIRERMKDPLPKSVMEQGGLARALLRDAKPKRILGLFNPVAPKDSASEFHRTHKVNTLRGTPPVPFNHQDPIWTEPVGIDLFNWGW